MSAGISQCAYINLHIIDLKLNLFLQAMNQAEALSSVNYRILKTISLNHQPYIHVIDIAYSNRVTVYFSFTNISHQTNSVHKMFFPVIFLFIVHSDFFILLTYENKMEYIFNIRTTFT